HLDQNKVSHLSLALTVAMVPLSFWKGGLWQVCFRIRRPNLNDRSDAELAVEGKQRQAHRAPRTSESRLWCSSSSVMATRSGIALTNSSKLHSNSVNLSSPL